MNILSNNTLCQVHYLTNSTAIVSSEDVSFALECGLPAEVIKAQGNWAGKDCKNYVNPSLGMCHWHLAATLVAARCCYCYC